MITEARLLSAAFMLVRGMLLFSGRSAGGAATFPVTWEKEQRAAEARWCSHEQLRGRLSPGRPELT